MPACVVHDLKGKKTEEMELPADVFTGKVNKTVLHQAVVMYLANQRQGNASTKERGSVSGGGIKPWRQKGTGRARAGSSRSPLWRGGGVVFGPHPRDYAYTVSKKVRLGALRESLNDKFASDSLFCVDTLVAETPKTKDFAKTLKALKLDGSILALVDSVDLKTMRASRNIGDFALMRACDVTAHDILKSRKLLVTKAALKDLLKRIK